MPEQSPSFRDFGLLPDDLRPPAETVRSFFPRAASSANTSVRALCGAGPGADGAVCPDDADAVQLTRLRSGTASVRNLRLSCNAQRLSLG